MTDAAPQEEVAVAQENGEESAANSRPKRERKQVIRLTAKVKEVIDLPLEVPEGNGTALGEIDNVRARLDKTKANTPILKKLHTVLYGKQKCSVKNVKAHIREFKGHVANCAHVCEINVQLVSM